MVKSFATCASDCRFGQACTDCLYQDDYHDKAKTLVSYCPSCYAILDPLKRERELRDNLDSSTREKYELIDANLKTKSAKKKNSEPAAITECVM